MPNQSLMDLVFKQDFATMGPGADDAVKPIPSQYDLGPGDKCVALTSDSIVDKELSLITIVDAEAHKETFPDYEDRLMKSYVLCDWMGQVDPVPALGWFARSRLIPLSDEEFEEIKAGMHDPEKREFPDWFMNRFQELTDELAKNQPDMVHRNATCGPCGSRKVTVHWSVEILGQSVAQVVTVDGQDVYAAQDEENVKATWQAHLHCTDCGATGTLGEQEFKKPDWMERL